MSRVTVINKSIKDEKIFDLFAQMTGSKAADPHVLIPKFNDIRKAISIIIKTLEKFALNTKLRESFSKYNSQFDEIKKYIDQLYLTLQYEKVSENDVDEKNIHDLYGICKKDENIKMISVLCARLRKDISLINDLNIFFIGNQSDNIYQPFPFTELDFAKLWSEMDNDKDEIIKKYILTVLKKLMEKSYEVHNILISPDVDIEEFSNALVEAISKARSLLPRCKQAFDKIEESVSMLKTNFNEYYKTFVISKNPNSILENFVLDVAKNQKSSTKLKWQFMQIVNFYKKQSSNKPTKDNNLNFIFDTLDEQFEKLNKFDGGIKNIDIIEEEKSKYILTISHNKYEEFLNVLLKKHKTDDINIIDELIDKYYKSISSSNDIPFKNLDDYKEFNIDEYYKKISA